MNRIWKFISRRSQKSPPQPPRDTIPATATTSPVMFEMMLQSIVAKRFVIDENWRAENCPDAPENPHPWHIVGAIRLANCTTDVAIVMAPVMEDGLADMKQVIQVPANKIGVAARQA